MKPDESQERVTYRRFYNHQYAAMVVAATIVAVSMFQEGARGLARVIAALIFLLPCILFPEAIGSVTGPPYATEPSHPGILPLLAWAILLLILGVAVARCF